MVAGRRLLQWRRRMHLHVCLNFTMHYTIGGHYEHPHHPPFPPAVTPYPPSNLEALPDRGYCYNDVPVNQMRYYYIQMPEHSAKFDFQLNFTGYCNGVWKDTLEVKVPDMVVFSTRSYYALIGTTTYHPVNHAGKYNVLKNIQKIAWAYHQEFPGVPLLAINDISLPWGGLFDVRGNWKPPHRSHCVGEQVDMRWWSVPEANREKLKEIFQNNGVTNLDQPEDYIHYDMESDTTHYHLSFTSKNGKYYEESLKCC